MVNILLQTQQIMASTITIEHGEYLTYATNELPVINNVS